MSHDRRRTCYHEAGHTIAAHQFGVKGFTVHCPDVSVDGLNGWLSYSGKGLQPFEEAILLASGPSAEARRYGASRSWDAGSAETTEFQQCLGRALATEVGDPRKLQRHQWDHRLFGLSLSARSQAAKLVADHWAAVCRVADALFARRQLSAAEVTAIISPPAATTRPKGTAAGPTAPAWEVAQLAAARATVPTTAVSPPSPTPAPSAALARFRADVAAANRVTDERERNRLIKLAHSRHIGLAV